VAGGGFEIYWLGTDDPNGFEPIAVFENNLLVAHVKDKCE
jgi:hypothetical protein